MELKTQVYNLARNAREASRRLACSSGRSRDAALLFLADMLHEERAAILEANARDVTAARENGLDDTQVDRLERLSTPWLRAVPKSRRHHRYQRRQYRSAHG